MEDCEFLEAPGHVHMHGRLYVEYTLLALIHIRLCYSGRPLGLPKISNIWSLLFIATPYLVNPTLVQCEVQSGYLGRACSFIDWR